MLQLVRVFADATSRLADAANRIFHLSVHERFRAEGLRGAELMAATQTVAGPLVGLIEPAVLYFHRKGWERANREDMILHLIEESTAPTLVAGELVTTVLFVDLSSFTPLSDAMGDTVAAQVVERFAELVREATARSGGQVVKQIGDAFMVVFADPRSAVTCGLEIEQQVTAEPRFPAVRLGAHTGTVLYREGDYVGVNVNIAARVAAEAQRHQLLITEALRTQLGELPDVEFVSLGRRRLKGLTEELELIDVRGSGARPGKTIDVVRGMEIDGQSAAGQLNWNGEELLFCSAGCLRRFLNAPDRYRAAVSAAPDESAD
jgi:class 3 adenylate cyclase/YHS domain-containing protein